MRVNYISMIVSKIINPKSVDIFSPHLLLFCLISDQVSIKLLTLTLQIHIPSILSQKTRDYSMERNPCPIGVQTIIVGKICCHSVIIWK